MLSMLMLNQRNISEDQFVADLTSLFRRRNISFGEPEDLERLASHLASDDAFQAGLFNLCTVIGRMAEVELTPRELLDLVARASGGPRIFDAEGRIAIPESAETAFLAGYEAWIKRDVDLSAFSESRHSDPFHTALALSAADGSRPAAASPRSIPPNAPLDSLTLAELRRYLEDIERRVSQIEPHLHQETQTTAPSQAHSETLESHQILDSHEQTLVADATDPEPMPIEAIATATAEPLPVVPIETEQEASRIVTERPESAALVSERWGAAIAELAASELATNAALDAARVKRLRTANIILAILLVISVVFAAAVAYRYLATRDHPANPNAATDQDSAPAPEPAPSPAGLRSEAPVAPVLPPQVSSPRIPRDADPSKKSPAPSAEKVQPTSTASEVKSPAPILRQSTEPTPAATPPAEATSTPARSPAPETKSADSANRPVQQIVERVEVPPARSVPTPPAAQVADARPTAPAAVPAPIPRSPEAANVAISVPSSRMMPYAIANPPPVNPPTRFNPIDTMVDVVAIISKEGKVTSAQALTGTVDVRTAAVQTMKQWRFKPYLIDGKAVEVSTTFRFLFKAR